jgi:hypothetical protein
LGFAEVSSHLVFIVKSAVELPKLRHNLAWKISTCGSLGFLVERVWCFLGADEEDYPWLLGTNVKGRAWAKVYQCPNELTRKVDGMLVNSILFWQHLKLSSPSQALSLSLPPSLLACWLHCVCHCNDLEHHIHSTPYPHNFIT